MRSRKFQRVKRSVKALAPSLAVFLTAALGFGAGGQAKAPEGSSASALSVQGKEHYVMRDGLRIYLWEKYTAHQEGAFSQTGKVALLVHGGTRSGRSLYDLQVRDYSLMDFLAQNGYDVWAIDIHGYGRSDKTATDWIDSHSAAADIAAAVEYITKLRGVAKIDLLGCSAGTQRTGVFVMDHPEKVAKWIFYAGFWKGTAEFREFNRKRLENGGQPLPRYRPTTEQDFRDGFVEGQFEEDVVQESIKVGLRMDPQRPNVFAEYVNLPILDPTRINVPTMIIHGEKDFAAKDEDLLQFYSQLSTHDKSYVVLPNGGHMLILEKDHRRFQHEVLSFFERP
jgi:pimeloyl-ACP methyl ester carboxylesterase